MYTTDNRFYKFVSTFHNVCNFMKFETKRKIALYFCNKVNYSTISSTITLLFTLHVYSL